MGFSRERSGKDGKPRYVALYRDLKGRQRSAGTYASKRQADRAWQRAEVRLELGRVGASAKSRQTFRQYLEETWLPNHEVEVTTRAGYTYALYKHLMPDFGPMRMIDIMPVHVRERVTGQKTQGVSPATIAKNKVILSAIFTTALNDQVTVLHPCKGVKIPPVPVKPRTIIHVRAVRRTVPGAAGRSVAAAGGDGDRERPAMGRVDRAARPRHRVRHPDADRQPRGRAAGPALPS